MVYNDFQSLSPAQIELMSKAYTNSLSKRGFTFCVSCEKPKDEQIASLCLLLNEQIHVLTHLKLLLFSRKKILAVQELIVFEKSCLKSLKNIYEGEPFVFSQKTNNLSSSVATTISNIFLSTKNIIDLCCLILTSTKSDEILKTIETQSNHIAVLSKLFLQ